MMRPPLSVLLASAFLFVTTMAALGQTAPAGSNTTPKASSPAPTHTGSAPGRGTASRPRPPERDMSEDPSVDLVPNNMPRPRVGIAGIRSTGPMAPPPPTSLEEKSATRSDWLWVGIAAVAVVMAATGTLLLLRRQKPSVPESPKTYDPYA
jgi:hypothetical protein